MQGNMKSDRTWDKYIMNFECQLNNAYNKTLGDTPFHVLFGYRPSFNDGVLRHAVVTEEWDAVEQLQDEVRKQIAKKHKKWKSRYDSKHSLPIQYKVGEIVFIRKPPEATGEPTKLQTKYRGPLVVTKVLPNDVYGVSSTNSEGGRRYATTVHVSHIKGYHLPESEEEGDLQSDDEESLNQIIEQTQETDNEVERETDNEQEPETDKRCLIHLYL